MVLLGGKRRMRKSGSKSKSRKSGSKARKAAKKNPWIEHVKKYARAHPNIRGGDLFAKAKKSYKKKK